MFADKYPEAPVVKRKFISDGRSANIDGSALYGKGRMFHGPRLQAVSRNEQVGSSEQVTCG